MTQVHMHPVPMTVITGFLGSGKTTLIAALLRRQELANTAVIINEFGEIGLDHELIESSEEDLVELSTGCLCCVMRGDLVNAVQRLMKKRNSGHGFERIVLETTGLADPAPILHATMADLALRSHVALDRVVVTVDGVNGLASLDTYDESRKQVGLADILLLTKTDVATSDAKSLTERLRAINPQARIVPSVLGGVDPAILIGGETTWHQEREIRELQHYGHKHHHHHDDITSVSLELDAPVPAVALTLFLEALAETFGADLLRLKGIVQIAEDPEKPAILHGVQHVFHPIRMLDAWPDAVPRSRLVMIGRRLSKNWIEALLETITEEVNEASVE